jgi:hypothetical protein
MTMARQEMRPKTHNGFVLDYHGPIFPATRSNQITYEYFCLKGGLANGRLSKIERRNGTHVYFTYHDISLP